MIIFTYRGVFFCYLCNPKCGTHTFYNLFKNYLLTFVKKIHVAQSNLDVLGYSDYNYYHCNLEGAINFFKEKKINLVNVRFFTTIRNPFELVLSHYWYALNFNKTNIFDNTLTQQEDFDNFVVTSDHFKKFQPKNFRFSEENNVNVNILRLEKWDQDFEIFCKEYNLPLNKNYLFSEKKFNTSNRSSKLLFNDKIIKYIIDNYSMDFKDGNYDLNPN